MALPQIKIIAEVTPLKGQPSVTVAAFFLASRPLEQQALDAFHAARPVKPIEDDGTGEGAEVRREANLRLSAALVGLFDASCTGVEITMAGDREPRQATVADVAGDVKIAMAMRLVGELEVRLNGPGQ